MHPADHPLRIVLHAPTASAAMRARKNAANLSKQSTPVEVRIVVNAEAVEAVLDTPDAGADCITFVCPHTLARIGRYAPQPLAVLEESAVLAIARMQADGWHYIRS